MFVYLLKCENNFFTLDKILREIKILQRFIDFLISRLSFQKVVKQIVFEFITIRNVFMCDYKMQKITIDAL